jgi:hypothetical protein
MLFVTGGDRPDAFVELRHYASCELKRAVRPTCTAAVYAGRHGGVSAGHSAECCDDRSFCRISPT